MHEVLLEMLVPRFAVNLKIEQLPPKSVGRLSADFRPTVHRLSTERRPTALRQSTDGLKLTLLGHKLKQKYPVTSPPTKSQPRINFIFIVLKSSRYTQRMKRNFRITVTESYLKELTGCETFFLPVLYVIVW